MEDRIKTGTVLIAEGAILPDSLSFESDPYAEGWRLIKKLDSNGFHQIIRQVGWNFFYIAGAMEAYSFGSNSKKNRRKAIKRIIAKLRARKFNCVEVTGVTAKRFLGMPYVRVSVHSRHVQKSLYLFGD
jgi:hypothetical protein